MTDEERRSKNRDAMRRYRETHREYFRAYDKARAQRRAEQKKAWREANRERVNETHREYVAAHPELREKNRAWSAAWHAAHREDANKDRNRRWYEKYGMAPGDYEAMLEKQSGRCRLCGTDQAGGTYNRFHVDHDHKTKRVRGLLCAHCNLGLGHFKDSRDLLQKAIKYLA